MKIQLDMNSRYLIIIVVLVGLVFMGSGCAKLGNGPSMNWSYGTYIVADSAFSPATNPPNTEIFAYAPMQVMQIEAGTKMAVGTYSLHGSNSSTYMYLYSSGTVRYSSSGTLTVTSNNNSTMSGNFSATFTDGSGINGSFSNLQIR